MRQPTFFEKPGAASKIPDEQVVLYSLGEFQARGKLLAERDLPLDRLRGAFKRGCDRFGVTELTDEQLVAALKTLGAKVRQVPAFVAKHPFRVIVSSELAQLAASSYKEMAAQIKSD